MASHSSRIAQGFLLVPFFVLLSSCVKGVDLDQTDEIVMKPSVAIDLANFSFESRYILDEDSLPVTERTDEIPLEIMNEDITVKLKSVDLYFSFRNTFQRSFKNYYSFYTEDGDLMYEVPPLRVSPGSSGNPTLFDTTVTVQGTALDDLKQASILQIKLEIGQEARPTDGRLDVKSTAIYNFEF